MCSSDLAPSTAAPPNPIIPDLRNLFGRYVGEDVARRAIETGTELGGEERYVGVLFVLLGCFLAFGAVSAAIGLPAFVVYGLSWLVADLLLSSVVGLIAAAIGQPQIVLLLVLPAAVLFASAFYASLHASVHACIEFDEVARAQQDAAATEEPTP